MGKKRISQLLDQLKQNQQQDIQNAAGIYTVAQIAVQELQAQVNEAAANPVHPGLPAAPALTQADLEARYGSYNKCRQAAKQLGIRFPRTPKWSQLVQAFEYRDRIQQLVSIYMADHPAPDIAGLHLDIRL